MVFSALFSTIYSIFSFVATHYVVLLVSVILAFGGAFLLSYYFYGFAPSSASSNSSSDSRQNSRRTSRNRKRVNTITEGDEEKEQEHVHFNEQKGSELRRMRKRDWAKKLYTSFVDGHTGRRTPSDDSSDSTEGPVRGRKPVMRRRHSSGPLQMAREFIRRGSRNFSKNHASPLSLPRPPQEFFEPTDLPEVPQNLPPEIFYILHNLKMLELPPEWKLDPRLVEVHSYSKGDYIVKPGDPDDSIYVVIEGTTAVYIKHHEAKEYLVKRITANQSFFSFLSMLDILMDVPSIFKTVHLKAMDSCVVAKFPILSFRDSYKEKPELWTRPIQIVITRFLHVTITTLHQYMGLSNELMKPLSDHAQSSISEASKLRRTSTRKKDHSHRISLDDPQELLSTARKVFADVLGLPPNDQSLFENKLNICTFEDGESLTEQNSEVEQLFLLLSGSLNLLQESVYDQEDTDEDDSVIAKLFPRDIVGGLQLLTSEPSLYTVRSCGKCILAVMNKADFYSILAMRPQIYLPIAHSIVRRLSSFTRGVDFALDWVLVDSGQAVYRAGDAADSLFVVLSGRLRSVENKTVVEEFGRGDVLGMVEVLQKSTRQTTVLAVRFSQLARVPEGLLNFIKLQFPQVGFRMVQLLGQYYTNVQRRNPLFINKSLDSSGAGGNADPMSHIKNLHTIAVVPASHDVPLIAFTCELYHALSANLRVLRLSSQKVAAFLDSSVLEKQADFRLMHWLNVQEDTYPLVIYECDYAATNWTRRCLRQADSILVVANGSKKPQKQTLLREILSVNQDGVRTNKELILLWPEDTKAPSGTLEWLKNSYYSGHHHIRAPKRMYQWIRRGRKTSKEAMGSVAEGEIIEFYEKNVFWANDHRSDFARLARILTGNAIGVVLGGGGARGAAHVGVLRALREQGVPVDIIGGTSIGSFIGGVYAETPDERTEERAKKWFDSMSSLWRKILDLTYAHSAMFTGNQFNMTIQDVLGDREIEDLWLPYFCISTNITTSDMRIHRSGPLWAYVRASMSLAGYLPPLCDPQDGHLLLDGGYVNNLPADVMRSMGAKHVIAVDVGSQEETNLYNYGSSLSGLWVLLQRLNPWSQPMRILNMEEIQSRLAYVSCVRQLEIVKKASYCHYMRPSIDPYKTLDFGKFDIIKTVGYEYGKQKVAQLLHESGLRASLCGKTRSETAFRKPARRDKVERATSFTDLAAAISKVPVVRPMLRQSVSVVEGMQADELYDDLMFLDHADADSEQSSDFGDSQSEAEDDHRGTTPRP